MTTRLTDTERTLLSALSDGELSDAETALAEQLLAGSEEARTYLRDLRSLNEFSQAAFPPVPAAGTLTGSLTSSAIQAAARATHHGFTASWGMMGLAAAAVTTIAVLTATLGGDADPVKQDRPQPAQAASPSTSRADVRQAALDLDSSALLVPAITSAELIDFAVSGRLPIDPSRQRYVSVAPSAGELEIAMHAGPGEVSRFDGIDLRAVPGFESIERALRTSLLQSEDNGIAVSTDLPTLRLRAIEELREVANELPPDVVRAMDDTRAELEREYQRLGGELRGSYLSARRGREAGVRYVVIAGTELPKRVVPGTTSTALTIATDDRRIVEVSTAELGSLEAYVERPARPRATAVTAATAPTAPARVFIRRQTAPRASARTTVSTAGAPDAADSTISFEQIQIMRQRGQTLDGLFRDTEAFIDRATIILQRADSIRRHIEIIRLQQRSAADEEAEGATVDDVAPESEGEVVVE